MSILGTVFRVKGTFPNMESAAMLNEKYQQNSEKNHKKIGMVVITGDGWVLFQGPVHTSKYGKMLFWMKNGNKIQKKNQKKTGMDW